MLTFFMRRASGFIRKLIDGLHCIDNFTMRCLDAQHREFFHMLYAGTKQVIVDLCQDPDYQQGKQTTLIFALLISLATLTTLFYSCKSFLLH